jgi:hypothetical protein
MHAPGENPGGPAKAVWLKGDQAAHHLIITVADDVHLLSSRQFECKELLDVAVLCLKPDVIRSKPSAWTKHRPP